MNNSHTLFIIIKPFGSFRWSRMSECFTKIGCDEQWAVVFDAAAKLVIFKRELNRNEGSGFRFWNSVYRLA